MPLDKLNTDAAEVAPVVTVDELTIYFSSDRPGSNASAIWFAHRTSKSQEFVDPRVLVQLSTSGSEAPDWISPDQCTMYLHRAPNRIYVAKRSPSRR
jgi:hypothetical protein